VKDWSISKAAVSIFTLGKLLLVSICGLGAEVTKDVTIC
jgi:hypothetical protein